MSGWTHRIRHDERGQALAMAMMIMTVLIVATLAVLTYSISNSTTSDRTRVDEATLYAAESGIDLALSRLGHASDPTVPTLLPSTTTTVGASSVTYSGSYNAGTKQWTVTSTATTASPAAATSALSRTVIQNLQVNGGGAATVAANPAWQYMYSDATTGCTTFANSTQISQPVYVKNDLCLIQSSKILPEAGTVQVGGPNGVSMLGSGSIGTSSSPLAVLKVANRGCTTGGSYSWPCTSAQKVWATSQTTFDSAISKPAIDLAARYLDASPGPKSACTSQTGTPPVFDNNTVMDGSVGTVDIMSGSSYTCTTATGQLSWDNSSKVLTVAGTIFIDGDLLVSNSNKLQYLGRATIYTYGTITLKGSQKICGLLVSGNCDYTNWDPETNMLIFASGSSADPAITLDQSMQFQGGLYAVGGIKVTSSVKAQGPMIGGSLSYASSAVSYMIPFTNLPPGAPGASGITGVTPISGTWREG